MWLVPVLTIEPARPGSEAHEQRVREPPAEEMEKKSSARKGMKMIGACRSRSTRPAISPSRIVKSRKTSRFQRATAMLKAAKLRCSAALPRRLQTKMPRASVNGKPASGNSAGHAKDQPPAPVFGERVSRSPRSAGCGPIAGVSSWPSFRSADPLPREPELPAHLLRVIVSSVGIPNRNSITSRSRGARFPSRPAISPRSDSRGGGDQPRATSSDIRSM